MVDQTMQGKVAVVTGANSGIGKCTARRLAELGAHVILVCRNPDKGREAQEEIASQTGSQPELFLADLGELDQVARVSGEIQASQARIDVLVNNAGVYMPQRRTTSAGHEVTFAVNHLGYFALCLQLLPALRAAPEARVVNVSSLLHARGRIVLDDLSCEGRSYSGGRAYADSKLMNVLFTRELARRLEGGGITANCLHPGVVRTGFAQDEPGILNWLFRLAGPLPIFITPEQGADTSVYLASSPEVLGETGGYWVRSRLKAPSRSAQDQALAGQLWSRSEELTGLSL